MLEKSVVSIVKGPKNPSKKDLENMVLKAIDFLGGIQNLVKKGDTVLIKPNLTGEFRWETGAVTNPNTVGAIIKLLKTAKPGEIIIGEASGIGLDTGKIFAMNGYDELAKELKVRLLDLNKDKHVKVEIPQGRVLKEVKIARTAVESDVLINVPVMKPHVLTSISLGLKNMKGILPQDEKRRFHLIGLEHAISDLSLAIKSNLTIIDGIIGQEGLAAPIHLGDPIELDLIIAGEDPVATDTVASIIMGFDPKEVKHLKSASELGAGLLDIEKIETRGEKIEKVKHPFKRATVDLEAFKNIRVLEKGACSTCIGGLYAALKRMEKAGEVQLVRQLTCIIGPLARPPKDLKGPLLVVGKCLKNFSESGNYVPGCPPQIFLIRDEVREIMGLPRLCGPKEPYLQQED